MPRPIEDDVYPGPAWADLVADLRIRRRALDGTDQGVQAGAVIVQLGAGTGAYRFTVANQPDTAHVLQLEQTSTGRMLGTRTYAAVADQPATAETADAILTALDELPDATDPASMVGVLTEVRRVVLEADVQGVYAEAQLGGAVYSTWWRTIDLHERLTAVRAAALELLADPDVGLAALRAAVDALPAPDVLAIVNQARDAILTDLALIPRDVPATPAQLTAARDAILAAVQALPAGATPADVDDAEAAILLELAGLGIPTTDQIATAVRAALTADFAALPTDGDIAALAATLAAVQGAVAGVLTTTQAEALISPLSAALTAITGKVEQLPTAGGIADAVWDEPLGGHQTVGTAGKAQSTQSSGNVDAVALAQNLNALLGRRVTTHSAFDAKRTWWIVPGSESVDRLALTAQHPDITTASSLRVLAWRDSGEHLVIAAAPAGPLDVNVSPTSDQTDAMRGTRWQWALQAVIDDRELTLTGGSIGQTLEPPSVPFT